MAAPISVTVEMYLGGAWTAITSYVRVRSGITITHGARSEGSVSDPSTALLVVNNADGRFTPKNTAGAYYGNLKRNTPLRIKVGTATRFLGEVSEFPSRWEESQADIWVPLVASGALRRLQHARQLESTLTVAVRGLAVANGDITGYWPVEDAPGSTTLASALQGGRVGTITGSPAMSSVDLGAGSHDVATWGGAGATFTATPASSTEFTAGFWVLLPTSGLGGGEEIFRCDTAGTAQSWRIIYSPGSGGGLFLQVIGSDGSELLATGSITGLNGVSAYVKVECSNSGADVTYAFSVAPGTTLSGTITTASCGAPKSARIGAGVIAIPAAAAVAVGHVVLGTSDTCLFFTRFDNGRSGYAGESVDARMTRLASENNITIGVTAGATAPVEMGAQPDGSLLDVLRAAEKADAGGILRDGISSTSTTPTLGYGTRTGRYNDQRAQLALNYSSGHLMAPFEPIDDDQQLRNQVRAKRIDGSSAFIALTSGALSSADYPSGVGPYPFEDSYATYLDSGLWYLASWILRRGTTDETRFPAVTVDLGKFPSLVSDAEALRPGYRLRITNLPAWAGASSVDLQVIGWSEYLTNHRRLITFVCDPGSPFFVFQLNSSTFGVLNQNYLAY